MTIANFLEHSPLRGPLTGSRVTYLPHSLLGAKPEPRNAAGGSARADAD
jgi:hypothetical protein